MVDVSTLLQVCSVAALSGALVTAAALRAYHVVRRRSDNAREIAADRDAARARVMSAVRIHGTSRRAVYVLPAREFIDRLGVN